MLKDLLNPSDRVLTVREHPEHGIFVEQAAEVIVRCEADVFRLLTDAERVWFVSRILT